MKLWIAVGLVLVAFVARLLPHPDNFAPALAIALFAGAVLPARLAFVVPLIAMASSDLVLGGIDGVTPVVYACLTATVVIGVWLRTRRTWLRTLLAAVGGSVGFFLITNFAMWVDPRPPLYAPTWEGLVQCYAAALPFFRNALAGDVLWTFALFGLYDLVKRVRRPRGALPSHA